MLHQAGFDSVEDGGEDTDYGWIPHFKEVPMRPDAGEAEVKLRELIGNLLTVSFDKAVVTTDKISGIRSFITASFSDSLKGDHEYLEAQPCPD